MQTRTREATVWTTALTASMALGFTGLASAASYRAPLLLCSAVTVPNTLSNCGSDPIKRGEAAIDDSGEVSVVVQGAGASQSYEVLFRTPDGSASIDLGALGTDSKGNGNLNEGPGKAKLPIGKISAGSIVLTRSGSDQYASGFRNNGGTDFRPSLIRCADVNDPAALSNCGTDTLKDGSVDIESDDGSLDIRVSGAAANAKYTAALRAPDGTELPLPDVNTDSKGKGKLISSAFFPTSTLTFGSGTVVLKRSGSDQFVSGFAVTQKPKPKVLSKSNLVRCLDITLPALSTCGADPLGGGSAQVDQTGKLQVTLSGAAPSTIYTIVFRPIDNSGDVTTSLSVQTDTSGNGKGSIGFPVSGTTASGNFVFQSGGFDQFLTGFSVK